MWDRIITYFETLDEHPVERMILLIGSMLVLWILEGAIPLLTLRYKKNKVRHATVNLSFTVLHLLIHTGLAFIIIILSGWCRTNQFGLVWWFDMNVFWTIIASLLVLDFFGGWLL